MTTVRRSILILALGLTVLMTASCGKDNPIAPFEPEVVNTADAFQFQITAAQNVTTTLSYTWNNSGQQATINHSTATTSGTATVTLLDASSNQVYTSGLAASATEQSSTGTAGNWTVVVVFTSYDGTANFRIERL